VVVKINAPAQRSLNANEKLVYDMLRKGIKPKEIAVITRIPMSPPKAVQKAVQNYDYWATYDTDSISVMDIIYSIRSKGYEIKEEDEMAKGYPIPQEVKDKIIAMYFAGVDKAQIVLKTGLSRTSVKRIINAAMYEGTEKTPTAEITTVGKEQSDNNIIADIRANCKPQIIKEILDRELTGRAEELAKKQREIDRITEYLMYIKEQYDYMLAEYEMILGVMQNEKT